MHPSDHEEGHTRTAQAMFDIYFASKDYTEACMEAYRAFRHAQKTGEQDEERFFEAGSRLRELVAHCVLYLREHPAEQQSIELLIDQLVMKRDKEEDGRGSGSSFPRSPALT